LAEGPGLPLRFVSIANTGTAAAVGAGMDITTCPGGQEVNMQGHRKSQVGMALARYLGMPPGESFARAELQRDLGLEPLDVVLFVLAFEESDGEAFRFEELEHVLTAGELVATVSGWLEHHDHEERLAEDDEAALDQRAGAA
jgi:hypothetical protein